MRIEVEFIEKLQPEHNHGELIEKWVNAELWPLVGEEVNFFGSKLYEVVGVRHLGQFAVQCFLVEVKK